MTPCTSEASNIIWMGTLSLWLCNIFIGAGSPDNRTPHDSTRNQDILFTVSAPCLCKMIITLLKTPRIVCAGWAVLGAMTVQAIFASGSYSIGETSSSLARELSSDSSALELGTSTASTLSMMRCRQESEIVLCAATTSVLEPIV